MKEALDSGNYQMGINIANLKLKHRPKDPLYSTCKAYAHLRLKQIAECREILHDIKPLQKYHSHPDTIMYLVLIYTALGQSADTVKFLELVTKSTHKTHKGINKQLFFAYVRENMLDK